MVRSLALLAAVAGAAVAADSSSTTSVLFIDAESPVYGSVVGADSTAVTFAAGCGTDAACDAEMWKGVTIKQGPSTFSIGQGQSQASTAHATGNVDCGLDPEASRAKCTWSMAAGHDGNRADSHFETVLSDYQQRLYPITLTAGLEKLSAAPSDRPASAASGPTSIAAATSATSAASASASADRTGDKSGAPASSATTSSDKTTNAAAAPAATQKAVLGGLAAFVAGVMAL